MTVTPLQKHSKRRAGALSGNLYQCKQVHTYMTGYKTILEANKHNTELLRQLVQAVNSWDDSLDSYEVYDFDDDFFDTYFTGKPEEAARATYFGAIQSWMDDYIRFNGYGNLESLSEYAYNRELLAGADEILDAALAVADSIDLDDTLETCGLLPAAA